MKKIVFLSVLSLLTYSCSSNVNTTNKILNEKNIIKQNINTNKYKLIGKAEFPKELNAPPVKNASMRDRLEQSTKDEKIVNGEIYKSLKSNEKVLKNIDLKSKLNIDYSKVRPIPHPRTEPFKVKASLDDITRFGTISLIYLPDHHTQANKTIGTGTTDEDGSFNLDISPNLTISDGEVFILEATARLGDSGTRSMSVRTYIKWDDVNKQWKSMTTPSLLINTKTTALAIIDDKLSSINPNETIDKINVSGITPVVTGINASVTSTVVNNLDKIVEKIVFQGRDAYTLIKYESNLFSYDSSYDLRRLTQTRDCSRCILNYIDLSKIDLTNKNLSYADLSGKNLDFYDFSDSILVHANLSGTTLNQTNFTNADLTNADLKGTSFIETNVTGSSFEGVDFSNATVNFVNFSGVNLRNSIFVKNSTYPQSDIYEVNFTNADLSYANLSGTITWQDDTQTMQTLQNATLKGINLSGKNICYYEPIPTGGYYIRILNLFGKDLSDSKFKNSTIYTNFRNTNLKNADFSDSSIQYSSFQESDLSYANFSNVRNLNSTTSFFHAYMTYTDLSSFNFTGTSLKGAIFSGKDLSNYDLGNTDLSYSMLDNVNLTNAIINSVNFTYSDFSNTTWADGVTIFPSNRECDINSIGVCN